MVADLASPNSGLNAAPSASPLPRSPGRIQVVESSPERLVVFLPHSASTGMMSVAAALLQIGLASIIGVLLAEEVLPLLRIGLGIGIGRWLTIGFAAALLAKGLATLFEWLRQRLTHIYLHVEAGRFVMQRVLFGRKQIRETILGPQPAAEIRTEEGERGTIHVNGVAGKEEFGTWLTPRERQWLVHAINQLARTNTVSAPVVRVENGYLEEVPRPVGLEELHLVPRIVVEEASSNRLRYRRRVYRASWELFTILVCEICLFASMEWDFWQGNVLLVGWHWFVLAVAVPFVEVVFVLLITFALIGSFTIDLTPEWLVADWRFGPIRERRRLATKGISRIVVRYGARSPGRSRLLPGGGLAMCLAVDGKRTFNLNFPGDLPTARRVGGILRHELARMGRPTDDV